MIRSCATAALFAAGFSPAAAEAPVSGAGIIDTMKHDIFVVTDKTFHSVIEKNRVNGVAVVAYYESLNPESKKFIDNVYDEVGKELSGMAKIAGMNCDEYRSFCDSQKVKGLSVVVYPPVPFPPLPYEGALEKKPLVDAIVRHIPGPHVQHLSEAKDKKAVETFLTGSAAVPRIILFSAKATPPVLYKALSNAFHDRMSFGFVTQNETALVERFKIKKYPTLIHLKGEVRPGSTGDLYTGALTFKALFEWLNIRSETFVKGGGYTSGAGSPEARPWLMQEIPELTAASQHDVCFKQKALCAIAVTAGGEPDEAAMASLTSLNASYRARETDRTAKFKFMWVDSAVESAFVEALGLEAKKASFVIFNPHKRLRYLTLSKDVEPTEKTIENLLETILGGNARFTNVKGQKLPPFATRVADAPATKDSKSKKGGSAAAKDEL